MRNKTQKTCKNNRNRKTILLSCALLLLAFVLFGAVSILRLDAWNEFEPERITDAEQTLIIYDKDGAEISRLHNLEDRIPISIQEVPLIVQKAFISAEDARFYDHMGIDIIRIGGAMLENLKAGSYVQGASTITQQLIKLSHLSPDKTMERKLEEAVLAFQMERSFTKDEILEMYLNYVNFGGGYYGIEAAALGYFGIHANELSVAQGALLAGILKSPTNYAPHINLEKCLQRRNTILNLMYEYGYLSEEQCQEAKQEEAIIVHGQHNPQRRGYYIDTAMEEACETLNITMEELLTGGYRLYTAMDASIQDTCEGIFQDDANFPDENAQGAIVVIEALSGRVAAMVGGRENDVARAFNRATDIRRQPGSVIKPIIAYAPAMELYGYTAADMLLDEPTAFNDYKPKNAGDKYYGWVTLRDAVKRSLNIPAVKVFSSIGVSSGMDFARRLGIEFSENDASLALVLGGFSYGVSPYQIAGAYACFAAGGVYNKATMVTKITNASGDVLFEHQPDGVRVMSEGNAFILTSILESVVEEGTGRRLHELNIPIAGKTGTVGMDNSDGNRDAWMAAYNPQYSAAVWLGNDTSAEGQSLPKGASGGSYPADILSKVFSSIYEGRQSPGFVMPDSVISCRLDQYTLNNSHEPVLATAMTPNDNVVTEYFVKGTEPVKRSQFWSVPSPPDVITARFDTDRLPIITFEPKEQFVVYRLYRQDKNGNTTVLGEWTNANTAVEFKDTSAKFGMKYDYYVLPVHSVMELGGRKVTGPASIRVTVQMEGLPFNE